MSGAGGTLTYGQPGSHHAHPTRRFGIPVQSSLTHASLCMVFVNDRSIEGVDIRYTLDAAQFWCDWIAMGVQLTERSDQAQSSRSDTV